MKEVTPSGSAFKLMFIQCRSCGCVVGSHEYHNTASLLEKLASKLGFKLFG